jgi:peptidoglycan/LPS O-acetylase OafA/YrhL
VFESLRGLLAVWVIAYHACLTAGMHAEAWRFPLSLLGKGDYAVDLFIILSGFVIFALLDNSRETYGTFIIRRAFRLYPVYLICLAVSAALIPLFVSTLGALPWWHPSTPIRLKNLSDSVHYFWPQLIIHLTLLHGLVPGVVLPSTDYAFIGQAWSISLEWQFYLVAPLYYKWISERNLPRVLLLSFALILMWYFIPAGIAFLPKSAYLFFVGITAYYGYRFTVRQKALLTTSASLIVILPILFAALTSSVPLILFSLVYSLVLGTVLMPGTKVISALSQFFEHGALLYLGRISYCLYLTHMIFIYVCAHFLILLFQNHPSHANQWAFFATLFISALSGTLLVSALLSQYVEYPLLNFGKRITAK